MYRSAWHAGLKTTYYLRSLGASGVEKATLNVKKEIRGAAGETKAETATRDTAAAATALNNATAEMTTAPFPTAGGSTADLSTLNSQPSTPSKKVFTAEEKRVCSIEAMKNGEECEACQ
jgi:ribonucleoside-diphosphate reductase alpha chain